MQPLPEFRQHHSVDPPHIGQAEFRPAWRVRTQLDTLLVRGQISPEAFRAGDRFRANWHKAFGSLTPSSLRLAYNAIVDQARKAGEPVIHLRTIRSFVELEQRLGKPTFNLLVALLILDLPWVELARRCKLHRTTAKQHAISALEELARSEPR